MLADAQQSPIPGLAGWPLALVIIVVVAGAVVWKMMD